MSKERRMFIAKETLDAFKNGYYKTRTKTVEVKKEIDNCVTNTILYTPKETDDLIKKREPTPT